MRKKKFSKKRFYRRLEAQNKNKGFAFDTAHPHGDYSVISIDPEAWKTALERAGQALGQWCAQLNDSLYSVAEYLATDEGEAALAKARSQINRTLEKRRAQVTDWDVMQSGYPDCLIYPDILSHLKVKIIKSRRRHGAGGFTGAVILDDHLMPDGGLYIPKDIAEKLGANKPLFNAQNSAKQPEPKPEFVPPPQPINIEKSEPNNDSGLFGLCFLHMAAIVACALLLCGILQKLSH